MVNTRVCCEYLIAQNLSPGKWTPAAQKAATFITNPQKLAIPWTQQKEHVHSYQTEQELNGQSIIRPDFTSHDRPSLGLICGYSSSLDDFDCPPRRPECYSSS